MLSVNTIPAGAHVALDVRKGILKVSRVFGSSLIVCKTYEIHDQNTTLDFFHYLETHSFKFASLHIT